MPRVQGCLLHTTSLPYIYTKFPRRDPSRGNRLYFCMELSFPDRRNRWVICSKRHKYKTIFSFRASFFGSGIKKGDGVPAIPLESMFPVVFIDVPFSLYNRLHHTGRLRWYKESRAGCHSIAPVCWSICHWTTGGQHVCTPLFPFRHRGLSSCSPSRSYNLRKESSPPSQKP